MAAICTLISSISVLLFFSLSMGAPVPALFSDYNPATIRGLLEELKGIMLHGNSIHNDSFTTENLLSPIPDNEIAPGLVHGARRFFPFEDFHPRSVDTRGIVAEIEKNENLSNGLNLPPSILAEGEEGNVGFTEDSRRIGTKYSGKENGASSSSQHSVSGKMEHKPALASQVGKSNHIADSENRWRTINGVKVTPEVVKTDSKSRTFGQISTASVKTQPITTAIPTVNLLSVSDPLPSHEDHWHAFLNDVAVAPGIGPKRISTLVSAVPTPAHITPVHPIMHDTLTAPQPDGLFHHSPKMGYQHTEASHFDGDNADIAEEDHWNAFMNSAKLSPGIAKNAARRLSFEGVSSAFDKAVPVLTVNHAQPTVVSLQAVSNAEPTHEDHWHAFFNGVEVAPGIALKPLSSFADSVAVDTLRVSQPSEAKPVLGSESSSQYNSLKDETPEFKMDGQYCVTNTRGVYHCD